MNKNMEQKEIDREFIEKENKYKNFYVDSDELSRQELSVSYDVLSDFRWELNLEILLLECCLDDDVELAKHLIKIGANTKGYYVYGMPNALEFSTDVGHFYSFRLLEIICINNCYKCAELLIQLGVDNRTKVAALICTCSYGSCECAKIIIESGVDIDKKDLFAHAKRKGNKDMIKLLKRFGYDK